MSMNSRKEFFKERIPKYRKSIALFAKEVLQFSPDPWQKEVFKDIENHPRIAVKSGQGVGKTGCEAIVLLWFLSCFPYPRVVATAPTRQQLHDVLWSEVAKWQSKSPILKEMLKWTKTYIYMIGFEKRWFAVARSATKPENMQGFHEDNMLFIIDEASGVADPIMEAIRGTLSGVNNKLFMCGNPTKTTGAFFDAFTAERELYKCHTVNSLHSSRTSKENIEALIKKYGADSNVVKVRVYGEFPTQEDDVFIPISIIEAATMREWNEEVNIIQLGVDVARFGDDETVIAERLGDFVTIPYVKRGQDLMATVGEIVLRCNRLLLKYPEYRGNIVVVIDDTGLGGGVTDRLNEVIREGVAKRIQVIPVNFASKVPDEEAANFYNNMTTWLWAAVREKLEDRVLVLENDNETVAQFSIRKYFMQSNGKISLETKKEMKKRGLSSPDRADAVALAMYTENVFDITSLIS